MRLRKIYTLLFALFIAINTYAQNDKKFWSGDNKLKWNDYHGRPDSQSAFTAFTYFGLDYTFRGPAVSPYKFVFEVSSFMDKGKSWKKGTPSNNLLQHEQLHFDIAEYFARQLLLAFNAQAYTSNYKAEMDTVYDRIATLRRGMEEMYDMQTTHSVNRDAQAQWNTFVADLISKNYSLTEALDHMPKLDRQVSQQETNE